VNQAMKEASEGELRGILGYNTAPLVSIDFNHDPRSSVFDATQTQVVDGALVRVMSWYDNEWGFSNRMSDTPRCSARSEEKDRRWRASAPSTTWRSKAPCAANGCCCAPT
jgi:glyceraldehyde-3-phosphate dehydrogenase/erythrose-4-phosphate dehydrogenase